MGTIEPMERRILMAGNVSVKFVGTQLRITGDERGNVFTVAEPIGLQSGTTSELQIVGLNGTTINGKPRFDVTTSLAEGFPYFASIKIAVGAGDDSVAINTAMNANSLSIDLGDGDDSFGGSQRAFSAVDIFAGEGRDRISLIGDYEKRVRIFAGGGRDRIYFSGTAHRGFDIDDSGSGGVTTLTNVTARRDSTIALGNSADRLSITNGRFLQALNVFGKGGNDQIAINGFVANRSSVINGGAGDDIFDLVGERINLSVIQ